MKKNLFTAFLLTLVVFLLPIPSMAEENMAANNLIRVNILFNEEIDHTLLKDVNASIINEYDSIGAATADVESRYMPVLEVAATVKEVTIDQQVRTKAQTVPWSHEKLNLKNQQPSSLSGKGVKIAIVDSGIDFTHPDLKIAGGKCVLDITEDPEACSNSYMDDNGHGTHVAGIIGAQNNSIGVAGIAPNAMIYGVKALDYSGLGTTSTILAAMDWCIQNKMDIINLSLSLPVEDLAMKAMIDQAYNQGILVVAAAGNEGHKTDSDETVQYPAKFSNVIAVSALNKYNQVIDKSSIGAKVEFSAPGNAIVSTLPASIDRDGYGALTGTSMAAPHVTAMAALYIEKYPNLTNKQIRQKMQQNALDLGVPSRDPLYGYGLVQADTVPLVQENETKTAQTVGDKGSISITITSLPEVSQGYNLYRNNRLIISSGSEEMIEDYGVKGNIEYLLVPLLNGEEMVDQSHSFSVNVQNPVIPDLNNDLWYSRNMMYLYNKGIINGYLNGEVRPNKLVTRAEAVAMLGSSLGYSAEKRTTRFKDVPSDSFASGYIQAAYEQGILNGFPDGTFKPNSPVTRVEMAILLSKAYSLPNAESHSYTDVNTKVTGYESIYKIAGANITQGYPDGTFRPYEPMSRSTYSVFLSKVNNPRLK
ncbi:alkaline serine protease [Peribacillus saganii]|uniref:Alkaline serine protease n=1 Tax=Peribacillus saganii TaxID=2303992 RepID=A0A372LP53_9BACI|nr:S8 family serine peptidase [Peribacillus saganii]RFU69535.1 alkaline serine protease [Peribacillus saganii]